MKYTITLHLTIDATSNEAARLWALQVTRELQLVQGAITDVAEPDVEQEKP